MPLVSWRRPQFAPSALLTALATIVIAVALPSSASAFTRCTPSQGTAGATPVFATTHPHVLVNNAPTKSCLQSLLSQGAPSATRFKAWVDDEIATETGAGGTVGVAHAYGFDPWFAALLGQVTGNASYCTFAVQYSDSVVADEEARIAGGEAAGISHDSYLYVGEGVGSLSLVFDWCHSTTTQPQRDRWIAYMNQAVWNVWHADAATWGGRPYPWSSWSTSNPSNNYYYSFLRATMLLGLATRGENAQAQTWIDKFRTEKIQNELIPTFTRDLAGGGSREGTGYGTAMKRLYELYDLWERSTGERIADTTTHARDSLGWMTNAVTPTLDRIVPVGDHPRDSGAWLFDYHREYLLILMSLYPGTRDASIADQVLAASTEKQMNYGFQYWVDYLYEPAAQAPANLSEFARTRYGAGSGMLTTRSSWTDKNATLASLVCGPYTESHAHMEHGSFQLFAGEWLAPTGIRYSHSGITGGTDMKNLVRLQKADGTAINQDGGEHACTLTALHDEGAFVYASADVTGAYDRVPAVAQVQRELLFVRPNALVVFDRVTATDGTRRVWTLNLEGAPSAVSGDHLTYLGDEHATDRLDVDRVAPAGLNYKLSPMDFAAYDDTPLEPNGHLARRVDVVDTAGTTSRFLHVLGTSTNGVAGTADVFRSDAAGMTGVRFDLGGGQSALARFNNDSPGGSVLITTAGCATSLSRPLTSGVVNPQTFGSAPDDRAGFGAATAAQCAAIAKPASAAAGAGAGTGASDARWNVAPKLRGKQLTLKGTFVKPGKPNTCPKTAKVAVKTKGKTVASGTVKLSRDRDLCKVTRGTLKLTKPAKTVSVRINGKGVKARTWATVQAAK